MVELKSDKTPIGMCGIINRDTLDHPDIGFAFLPEYTGMGYAFEMAGATLTFAKEILKIPVLCAITVPENKSSIKLLKKIGMEFQHRFSMPDDPEELMLFKTSQ